MKLSTPKFSLAKKPLKLLIYYRLLDIIFIDTLDLYKKNNNRKMITDTQIFIALVLALISALLAIRLGTKLYA